MGEIEEQLERLAEHRAAQVPPFSMPTGDELVDRRRVVRRDRLVAHRGLSGRRTGDRRPAPVRSVTVTVLGAGAAGSTRLRLRTRVCTARPTWTTTSRHGVGDHHGDGRGVGAHHRRHGPGGVAITPDGKHAYVTNYVRRR